MEVETPEAGGGPRAADLRHAVASLGERVVRPRVAVVAPGIRALRYTAYHFGVHGIPLAELRTSGFGWAGRALPKNGPRSRHSRLLRVAVSGATRPFENGSRLAVGCVNDGSRSAQPFEERADILGQQLWLLERGEMAASRHFCPALDIVEPVRPLAGWRHDVLREQREARGRA